MNICLIHRKTKQIYWVGEHGRVTYQYKNALLIKNKSKIKPLIRKFIKVFKVLLVDTDGIILWKSWKDDK